MTTSSNPDGLEHIFTAWHKIKNYDTTKEFYHWKVFFCKHVNSISSIKVTSGESIVPKLFGLIHCKPD